MQKYITYICGDREKAFIRSQLEKAAMQSALRHEDVHAFVDEVNKWFNEITQEVMESCQAQRI